MQKKNLTNIFSIVLVIISMLTIFLFSSENASSSNKTSKEIVKKVVSLVIKEDNSSKLDKKVDKNILIIRKSAHLVEYFILGFLLINVVTRYKGISKKNLFICIILAFIYACTDEFHQLYVGRNAKYYDVLIDTFGSVLGIITYNLIYKKFHHKNKEIA